MKVVLMSALFFISLLSSAQDLNVVLKEADNFDKSLKEDQALEKFKQALNLEPNNITALQKAAELSCLIAGRQTDKKVKKSYVDAAKGFADKALALSKTSADAYYVMSVVASKLAEVETENKAIVEDVRKIKLYADSALMIKPDHAKANFAAGRWHFEMVQLSWVKKVAAKTLFGGMPGATIEEAVRYMEKCKSLDQYYVLNYLTLAKAYKFDNKPAKAIEVLTKLIRLPNRTSDDAALKAEGKKLLEEMQ